MMLHHLVTMYLYSFSYVTNTLIGGVIAYLHDISDIFISLTRTVSETEYKTTAIVLFFFTICSFVYTRIYVFSQCIYIVTYKLQVYAGSPYLKPIFGLLLMCLLVLHVYWFFLCCKILSNFFTKGVAEDSANNSAYTEGNSPTNKKTVEGRPKQE